MTQELQPHYYTVTPASVRYDKELSYGAVLIYGELTSLSGEEGLDNLPIQYLADLYDVSKQTIYMWISQLEKRGHIKTKNKKR